MIKSARSALRNLFNGSPPMFKSDLSDSLVRPPHAKRHAQPAGGATPTAEAKPTPQPAQDIEVRPDVFSFRTRQPKRVDHRFAVQAYKGSRDRSYRMFVPSRYNDNKPMPLVMVLHGCHQTHKDIAKISNLDQLAEREGFLVVYPFVSSYSGIRAKNCWGWWLPSQTRGGQGEVEDLAGILDDVGAHYCVDARRTFVAGLSSGAGMAVALMVTHSQRIAAGCAVAGVAYGESAQAVQLFRPIPPQYRPVARIVSNMEKQMPEAKQPVPLIIIHSHDDKTVPIKAAKNLRDSWAQCFGISLLRKASVKTGETGNSSWQFTRYRGHSHRQHIETLWLRGPGHGWYGGNSGKFSYPNAVDISQRMWQFFKDHHIDTA